MKTKQCKNLSPSDNETICSCEGKNEIITHCDGYTATIEEICNAEPCPVVNKPGNYEYYLDF